MRWRAAKRSTEQAWSTCDNLELGRFEDFVGILHLDATDFDAHRDTRDKARIQRHFRPVIPRSLRVPRGLPRVPSRGGLSDFATSLTYAHIRDYYSKDGSEVAPRLANLSWPPIFRQILRHHGGQTLRSGHELPIKVSSV